MYSHKLKTAHLKDKEVKQIRGGYYEGTGCMQRHGLICHYGGNGGYESLGV
jgi:hypothetical protein